MPRHNYISLRLCEKVIVPVLENLTEPGSTGEEAGVIQLLTHGGSYTKDYWGSGNFPGFDGEENIHGSSEEKDVCHTFIWRDRQWRLVPSCSRQSRLVRLSKRDNSCIIGQLHVGEIGNKEYSKVFSSVILRLVHKRQATPEPSYRPGWFHPYRLLTRS